MNTLLWIVQGILCVKFLSVAFSHGLQSNNLNMKQAIDKLGENSLLVHKIISAILFVAAILIVLPALLHMDNWITIYTAVTLAVLMMVSIPFHLRSRETPLIIADVILLLLAAFVTYGRWGLFPL
jgi:VIT1/CCC1 family predicted Fe2+/Mn2+ transporter